MEADSSVGIRTRGSVLEVTLYYTADSRQLAADLMMASSEQVDFQQLILFCVSDVPESKSGKLCILCPLTDYVALVLLFVTAEPVGKFA